MSSEQTPRESASIAEDDQRLLTRQGPPLLSLASFRNPPETVATARPEEQQPGLPSSRLEIPTGTPLLRTRSQRAPETGKTLSASLSRPALQSRRTKAESDRTDALWMEMQATLAEVELSAARGIHFFGSEHTLALEELRTSQIALAQAWARSEADETTNDFAFNTDGGTSHDAVPSHSATEEAAGDILLARKRREANDRYFWRVKTGVLDVVGKLEAVAAAMGKVEKKSREIWSENDGMENTSVKT